MQYTTCNVMSLKSSVAPSVTIPITKAANAVYELTIYITETIIPRLIISLLILVLPSLLLILTVEVLLSSWSLRAHWLMISCNVFVGWGVVVIILVEPIGTYKVMADISYRTVVFIALLSGAVWFYQWTMRRYGPEPLEAATHD